jgi:PAS domain-containing protein
VIRSQCTVLPDGGRLLTYTLVTDIVRHADELEVLRSALDNIQDGVLLLDADLNAQFLNRKMREYWGGNGRPGRGTSGLFTADYQGPECRRR